ncbi:DoxX family protein [Natronobacterium texcoconense]|uniref:Thiosulfate dehydrogenase [quinone] large subunit n=1 Tax=Natronobacterium texcoconense TaxID=1095778 RepID=A0A1H1GKJ7_NATTX|nr:DoxX family protein [Natronobacterium texcoconense]SDR13710.1 thiosulfate dehydrogenase [quinone] large subunit [Natronobacterium texcoconense]
MSTTTRNRLESRFGGVTLTGEPHALSAWFVVALRFVMGGMMLFAGLGKFAFVSGEAFDASGFLVHGVDPASPVSGLYAAMAGNAALLEVINVIVPVTQVLIGVALIAGAFVRLAALGGAMQMGLFYLGGWEGQWLALFDSTLIYAVVFLALGAFAAGRIAGLDRYIEQTEVGGQPLLERYPKLRYLLG